MSKDPTRVSYSLRDAVLEKMRATPPGPNGQGVMMPSKSEFVEGLTQEIARLKDALKPFESGEMQMAERHERGPWIDTTPKYIEELKHIIAVNEAILARIER